MKVSATPTQPQKLPTSNRSIFISFFHSSSIFSLEISKIYISYYHKFGLNSGKQVEFVITRGSSNVTICELIFFEHKQKQAQQKLSAVNDDINKKKWKKRRKNC